MVDVLKLMRDSKDEDPSTRLMALRAFTELDQSAIPALSEALTHQEEELRAMAADQLGQLKAASAADALFTAAQSDKNDSVREAAVRALVRLGDSRAFEFVLAQLEDKDPDVRSDATYQAGTLGDPRAFDLVLANLGHPNADVRSAAASALGSLGDPRAGDQLAARLGDEERKVSQSAAISLAELDDPRGDAALLDRLKNGDAGERWWAADKMGRLAKAQYAPYLTEALSDGVSDVQRAAREGLDRIGSSDARD
jgi:HEAT repeat protein